MVSRIESRITALSTVNIPANQSDPDEPDTGSSFHDMMNVEHMSQPVTDILSIDYQLGYNVSNSKKYKLLMISMSI